jgi:hypothetical protein
MNIVAYTARFLDSATVKRSSALWVGQTRREKLPAVPSECALTTEDVASFKVNVFLLRYVTWVWTFPNANPFTQTAYKHQSVTYNFRHNYEVNFRRRCVLVSRDQYRKHTTRSLFLKKKGLFHSSLPHVYPWNVEKHEWNEKCIPNYPWEVCREEISWQTRA